MSNKPTITKTLKAVLQSKNLRFQFLHQAVSRIRLRGKKHEQYTELTVNTDSGYSPKDAMFPDESKMIGIIVWIPTDEYKAARGGE